jgi:hypothetical protein
MRASQQGETADPEGTPVLFYSSVFDNVYYHVIATK